MTYKGCTFTETSTTTTTTRQIYGRLYEAIAPLWEISGRFNKPAGTRPLLVSAAACRRYVNASYTDLYTGSL